MLIRLLAGLAIALAVLVPTPDRSALLQQSATRLVLADRESDASIFQELVSATGEERRFRIAGASDPIVARSFRAQLNLFNESLREREQAPLVIDDASDFVLALRTLDNPDGAHLDARLRQGRNILGRWIRGPQRVPGPTSLIPPLLAIGFALILRRVILALFAGVWAGAALLRADGGMAALAALPSGLWDVFARYFTHELVDSFRIEVIGFVIALLGVIGVATRAGGIAGLVDLILRYARSVRSALGVSFGMGLMLFFDDYANCLVVGNSMRPVTDRLRISREKLAYIVDSTAAPVAGLSIFSTWIAFEVSTYAAQLPAAGIADGAYAVFFWTLPYRFYSILALAFVFLVILTRRDFGPMLAAERRARSTGELVRAGGQALVSDRVGQIEPHPELRPSALRAILPIGAVVALTLEGIFRDGGGYALLADDPDRLLSLEGLTGLLLAGSGAGPLFRAASGALIVAAWLAGSVAVRIALALGVGAAFAAGGIATTAIEATLAQPLAKYLGYGGCFALVAGLAGIAVTGLPGVRLREARPSLGFAEIGGAAFSSTRALGFAIVILFLAWMIGAVCEDVGTADYLVALSARRIPPELIPALLFCVACVVAFSTGTSWGTMSILLPNVVAMAAVAGEDHALGSVGMVTVCIGAVLEGSIFGDHCSPISDTTVLSSVATASDHLDHVRTQLPYAVCVAAAALGAGYVPTTFIPQWNPLFAYALALGGLVAVLFVLGRRVD